MNKVRIGLIGCGFMGAMHANCYNVLSGAELVAVADIRPEKAEAIAKQSGAEIYKDGMDLIRNAEVDAIDICLPTYMHTNFALAAMEKVKYIFIEKPVALTEEECALLESKQKKTGCQIQVGQVIRFWDEYVKLKEFIDNKTFGKVANASFHRISPRPTWGWENWLLDDARSGGACQDLAVHDTDFILSLFGTPLSSHSVVNKINEKKSFIGTHYQYEDFVVTSESTWDLPLPFHFNAGFRVMFEKAAVELSEGKLLVYYDDRVEEVQIEKPKLCSGNAGGNISDLGGYYNELLYFVEQINSSLPIEKATLSHATASLRFLLKEING